MDAQASIESFVDYTYHPSFGWVFGVLLLLSLAEMYWNTKYDIVRWYNPAGGSITYEASLWREFQDEWWRLRYDSVFVKPFKMFEWMSTMYVDVYFKKLFNDYQLESEQKHRRFVHRRRQFMATVSAMLLLISALVYYRFPVIRVVTLFTFCFAVVSQLLLLFAAVFDYWMSRPYRRPRSSEKKSLIDQIIFIPPPRDLQKEWRVTHVVAALVAAAGSALSVWYACFLKIPVACTPFTIPMAAVCAILVSRIAVRWMGLFYTPPKKS